MVDKRHPEALRRNNVVVRRATRPNRSWAGFALVGPTSVAATSKVLVATFVLSNANIDETILRTVGTLAVFLDQVAADESQVGAMGFIVINDLAIAAGAASIPGPITDIADDGWFVYVPITQRIEVGDSTGVEPHMATQYNFDSRAKRRIEEGRGLAVMVENAGSTGFNVSLVFRTLSMIS